MKRKLAADLSEIRGLHADYIIALRDKDPKWVDKLRPYERAYAKLAQRDQDRLDNELRARDGGRRKYSNRPGRKSADPA